MALDSQSCSGSSEAKTSCMKRVKGQTPWMHDPFHTNLTSLSQSNSAHHLQRLNSTFPFGGGWPRALPAHGQPPTVPAASPFQSQPVQLLE